MGWRCKAWQETFCQLQNAPLHVMYWSLGGVSEMMMMTWLEEEAIHRPELHNARPKCTKGVATPQSLNDVC